MNLVNSDSLFTIEILVWSIQHQLVLQTNFLCRSLWKCVYAKQKDEISLIVTGLTEFTTYLGIVQKYNTLDLF